MGDSKRPINLEMIVSKNCSHDTAHKSLEDSVLRLKRIWLDKMGITHIDNLEMLGNISHIYLDWNSITTIENLETLASSLQHLSLKGNQITDIEDGLICLSNLMSLDLSENKISTIKSEQFPSSIKFFNILGNPVVDNSDFDQESFLSEFPEMKVYNKNVLNPGEEHDDDSDDDEEEEEDDVQIDCLQDLTRQLKQISKERQAIIDETHQGKVTTLALLKTEMTAVRQSNNDFSVPQGCTELQRENSEQLGKKYLPPLERPLSSHSISKRAGQLDPLPSSPSITRLTSPQITPNKQTAKQATRVNSPKRLGADKSQSGTGKSGTRKVSLRQPLEMELVKADDFDDYIDDVNKKFSDLRTRFEGL